MKYNIVKKLTALTETKFLSLYDAVYENRKGIEKHWIIASRKNYDTLKTSFFEGTEDKVDAVVIAAFHEESRKLVLIKQFRIPLNDYIFEMPAGLLDNNESMETAVGRELKEETGLDLIMINHGKTKKKVYLSPGMTDESVDLVYCTCRGNVTTEYVEDDEDIEVVLVSQKEARDVLKTDMKIDIKVSIILECFAELGDALFYQVNSTL